MADGRRELWPPPAVLLLVLVLQTEIKSWAAKVRGRNVLQFRSLQNCPPGKQPLELLNVTITGSRRGETFIEAAFENHKEAKRLTKAVIDVTSCRDAISSNTCEHFGSWTFSSGVCAMLSGDAVPWGAMAKAITPAFRCDPTPPGKYYLHNGSLNVGAYEKMMGNQANLLAGKIWIGKGTFWNEKKQVHICMEAVVSFLRARA